MADISKIKEFLDSEQKHLICAVLIDEFAYDISKINKITDKTTSSDTVLIGYSVDVEDNKVISTTHYITLEELEGADTVVFATYQELARIN